MSRRRWILLGCVLVLVVGLEVAVWWAQSGRNRVKIINSGLTPIQNLVVSYAGTKVSLGGLEPGETGYAYLSGREKGTLDLAFTQAGNPMAGFQITDYDPRVLRRDGLEQVLDIKVNQVTKYMDDAGASSAMGRLYERLRDWVADEFDSARL
jgi:hypothetical protein